MIETRDAAFVIGRERIHAVIVRQSYNSVVFAGVIEIRDAAFVLGQCPKYGSFVGAMVDVSSIYFVNLIF